MSALAESFRNGKFPLQAVGVVMLVVLVMAALMVPSLKHTNLATLPAREVALQREAAAPQVADYLSAEKAKSQVTASLIAPDVERKMVRTSSIDMVVQHPAEVSDRITALAERLGGFLVSSDGGGQSAASGSLTIRVPSARFEEARGEIRKLGLRVESEKVEAQDVTRQYVDQDANLRNLRAEEAQYLTILKQASTVKDMLAVSEKLSEVRGQIEQQQAEFNALSKQTETVAIAIALRTETEAQVFGLNWRPGYQLKLALRDGLESLATYAGAMVAILFYLPAVLLWTGTILIAILSGWKLVRWAGRRWFGWKITPAVQG